MSRWVISVDEARARVEARGQAATLHRVAREIDRFIADSHRPAKVDTWALTILRGRGVRCWRNSEKSLIFIHFTKWADVIIRDGLKRDGFKWNPQCRSWTKKLTERNWAKTATVIFPRIAEPGGDRWRPRKHYSVPYAR
jgi:hypothetical protein